MRWNHLPRAGGIADQHPDLLEGFRYIFAARNEYEAEQAKKRENEAKRNRGRGGLRGASRSR